ETRHVCKILAQSGLDWSALLNQPAYDDAALREITDESAFSANSCLHGHLAAKTPFEVMRWGNKQLELQAILNKPRLSRSPFWNEESAEAAPPDETMRISRRSRLVEWLGDAKTSQELLRRLGEVESQQTLIQKNPDAHWWAYRKTLRKQLQDRP